MYVYIHIFIYYFNIYSPDENQSSDSAKDSIWWQIYIFLNHFIFFKTLSCGNVKPSVGGFSLVLIYRKCTNAELKVKKTVSPKWSWGIVRHQPPFLFHDSRLQSNRRQRFVLLRMKNNQQVYKKTNLMSPVMSTGSGWNNVALSHSSTLPEKLIGFFHVSHMLNIFHHICNVM